MLQLYLLKKQYEDAQQLLLEVSERVDLNECSINGQNYLHTAAAAGATVCVETLHLCLLFCGAEILGCML